MHTEFPGLKRASSCWMHHWFSSRFGEKNTEQRNSQNFKFLVLINKNQHKTDNLLHLSLNNLRYLWVPSQTSSPHIFLICSWNQGRKGQNCPTSRHSLWAFLGQHFLKDGNRIFNNDTFANRMLNNDIFANRIFNNDTFANPRAPRQNDYCRKDFEM